MHSLWEVFNNATTILYGKLETWGITAVRALPNLCVAFGVVIFSFLAARFIASWSRRLVSRTTKISHDDGMVSLTSGIVRLAIVTAGIFVALGVLNLEKTVTSLLAGVGIIGLALGFAFQDLAANFVAGVFIAFSKPFLVGQTIQVQDLIGTVTAIRLRNTVLTSPDGTEQFVPNKKIFENVVTNLSSRPDRRISVRITVSYADNLEEVGKIIANEIFTLPFILKNPGPSWELDSFNDLGVAMFLRVWVDSTRTGVGEAKNSVMKTLTQSFAKHKITVPVAVKPAEANPKII